MLGWWFVVTLPVPGDGEDVVLAKWEAGLDGIDWITGLVAAGRAERSRFDGYPHRFTVRAGEVLPLLADGSVPGAGCSSRELHPDRIAGCPADALLTVDAWDQS
ncbi:hypothetical protein ACIQ9P_05670 [Kitasatospora sp. NPDC094019]|uniref:hypothetical protein n=1 Tax=Kitasatospora sp. NPDC094019 TaxID=3364091 RepID=UPI003824A63C